VDGCPPGLQLHRQHVWRNHRSATENRTCCGFSPLTFQITHSGFKKNYEAARCSTKKAGSPIELYEDRLPRIGLFGLFLIHPAIHSSRAHSYAPRHCFGAVSPDISCSHQFIASIQLSDAPTVLAYRLAAFKRDSSVVRPCAPPSPPHPHQQPPPPVSGLHRGH